MQVNITGHHVEITTSLNDFIVEKFKKLERHFEYIINTQVILTVEKLAQKSEAILKIRGGEVFAESTSEDMYASIDTLVDKLDRQLLKHKEKLTAH
ncbi:MAG: ribosomal subunit interface protein [Gammaproteobacteria bacterium CG22_combo_CG10-13_8_21_14_all_40_8]|nr:MAG: ribosomal subunit interface protein [Gammaproteobacteria bacterium CG22_combo_CG10-13_8_21_14_all_40_8]